MFKGIYHGKQCHAADIPAVLARAWAAGVDRIIVSMPSPPFLTRLGFLVINFLPSWFWWGGRSPEAP